MHETLAQLSFLMTGFWLGIIVGAVFTLHLIRELYNYIYKEE